MVRRFGVDDLVEEAVPLAVGGMNYLAERAVLVVPIAMPRVAPVDDRDVTGKEEVPPRLGPQPRGQRPRAVGGLPDELGGRAADAVEALVEDDRVDAEVRAQLRQLGDLPERKDVVPALEHVAELQRPLHAGLQVADDRLAVRRRAIRQRIPRADLELPVGDHLPDHRLGLRANLQVVVQQHDLPIEMEVIEPGLLSHDLEEMVETLDELHARLLELPPKLAVPVGVADDVNGGFHDVFLRGVGEGIQIEEKGIRGFLDWGMGFWRREVTDRVSPRAERGVWSAARRPVAHQIPKSSNPIISFPPACDLFSFHV